MIRCSLCDADFPTRDGYPVAYGLGPLMVCEPCAKHISGDDIPEHVARAAGFMSAAAMAQEMHQQRRGRIADEHCRRILAALSEHTQCTVAELCELTGLERGRVHSMIARLRRRGADLHSVYVGTRAVYWLGQQSTEDQAPRQTQPAPQRTRSRSQPTPPTPPNAA